MGIQRRVALIGCGQGPWISTQGLAKPRAKVTGMRAGGLLHILMCNEPGGPGEGFPVHANGVYELKEYAWMKVESQGCGRNVICDILTQKAVA